MTFNLSLKKTFNTHLLFHPNIKEVDVLKKLITLTFLITMNKFLKEDF